MATATRIHRRLQARPRAGFERAPARRFSSVAGHAVCLSRPFAIKARGMDRASLAAAVLAVAAFGCSAFGCSPAFKDKRTPSGDFCSDMAIVPAGQEPEREYHRLQPIQSDPKARTEAERLESLRKAACKIDADAVIEAVNEEVRGDNAQYAMVSSGTAVIRLRPHTGEDPKPLGILAPPRKPTPIGAPTADAPAPPVAPVVVPDGPAPAKPGAKPPPYKPGSKLPAKPPPASAQ